MTSRTTIAIIAAAGAALACAGDSARALASGDPAAAREALKAEFVRDHVIEYPDDNQPDAARTALGKVLFFDPRLSKAGAQSCASCHNPSFDWGDGLGVGRGAGQEALARRSPTILNLAWAAALMWDGRAHTLEEQSLGPIQADVEMAMPIEDLIERLEGIEGYAPLFAAAFDGDATIAPERIALALAAYERTVVSGTAPFDRWVDGDETAISDQAKEGFDLFAGKAKCSACHDTWRFTDDGFHDIGLQTQDIGRGKFLPDMTLMQHAFKTPTLRNVARRMPYMHAGQVPTLRASVVHYNEGGVDRPSRSPKIGPLGLSEPEIDALVAFMNTLTSEDPPVTLPVLPQ